MHLGVFTDAVLSEGLPDSEELRGLIPVKVHSELGELCKWSQGINTEAPEVTATGWQVRLFAWVKHQLWGVVEYIKEFSS